MNGIGASLIWIAEGDYIKQCSTEENIASNQGLFYSINLFNMILGNLLGIFFAKKGQPFFFVGLLALTIIAAILFCCSISLIK